MAAKPKAPSLETEFFRMLNRVVEPLVRAGVGSPRIVPGGLIVLEATGRKSGRKLRSPLVATRIGKHVIIATYRGDRSQWVRNLSAQPNVKYWLGGNERDARAFVMNQGKRFRVPKSLPSHMQRVVRFLAPYTKAGWAFAVLSPLKAKRSVRKTTCRDGCPTSASSPWRCCVARTTSRCERLPTVGSCQGPATRSTQPSSSNDRTHSTAALSPRSAASR